MTDALAMPASSPDAAGDGHSWRLVFAHWPPGVPYQGVVVTSYAEQIPFEAFQFTDELVLLDRPTPDTVGARRVILPYGQITALKITSVTQTNAFEPVGFTAPAKPEKPKAERPRRPFVP